MAQSSSFGTRKKLKTSMVAMMNLKGDPYVRGLVSGLSSFFNKWCGANFRMQAFPVPFTTYARGMDLVIFEEFPTGELARHLSRDLEKRNATLMDAEYRKKFKKHYMDKLSPKVWQKDFGDAYVTDAPDKSWIGKSFLDLANERGQHPVDTFLDIVVDLDKKVEWKTTIGNHDPLQLGPLYNDENGILGFADSGAHIDNMAFYNLGVRVLKYVKDSHERGQPFMSYEKAVYRLTKENADFFNLDAGSIEVGKRADITVIDPNKLSDSVHEYHKAPFLQGLNRLVNRDDEVVNLVLIGGKVAWENGAFDQRIGNHSYGKFLKGKHVYN
jgi:N-acyl-D-aspartate/D-glutamate deacylase